MHEAFSRTPSRPDHLKETWSPFAITAMKPETSLRMKFMLTGAVIVIALYVLFRLLAD